MRLGGASNTNFKSTITANKEVLKTWKNHGFSIPIQLIPLRIIKRLAQFI
jgi:glycosyltransferase